MTKPADVVDRLRQLYAEGSCADDWVAYLACIGSLKSPVLPALRQAHSMFQGEAKIAVHDQTAYDDRRASDETFQESASSAMEEIQAWHVAVQQRRRPGRAEDSHFHVTTR